MIFRKKQPPAASDPPSKGTAPAPRPEWDLQTVTRRLSELTPAL